MNFFPRARGIVHIHRASSRWYLFQQNVSLRFQKRVNFSFSSRPHEYLFSQKYIVPFHIALLLRRQHIDFVASGHGGARVSDHVLGLRPSL